MTGATAVSTNGVPTTTGAANVRELGTAVFTTYLFAFEATAALLVIAVVGAVAAGAPRAARRRGGAVNVPAAWYLVLAAVLFGIGAFGLLTRRSALIMFMCVELMLNAVTLTFVTFARTLGRHRRPGDGLLRDGGRRGRGHRGAGHRGRGLPAAVLDIVDELSEMKG